MLKRYQVLLEDWLADHLKSIAERYDISFSEVIRLALCLEAMREISKNIPRCKFGISDKEVASIVKREKTDKDFNPENFHRLISKTYFEARKAIECWQVELQKKKK